LQLKAKIAMTAEAGAACNRAFFTRPPNPQPDKPPVEKKSQLRLTGPAQRDAVASVSCFTRFLDDIDDA
jgi:hypothetical protein